MVEPIIKHNKLILTIFNKTRNHTAKNKKGEQKPTF